jgi:hypothetical protein
MSKILNELADMTGFLKLNCLYIINFITRKRTNLLSGGNSESIFTIVEQVEEGHVALVSDSWFLLTENNIEKTLLETHVKDEAQLRSLRTLELL